MAAKLTAELTAESNVREKAVASTGLLRLILKVEL
jgi:hypothetical protein